MNDSLDSISSFFNKLLNIKSKDSSKESSSKDLSSGQSPDRQTAQSNVDKMNSYKSIKTTNKITVNHLKAGSSDILDESVEYLSSISPSDCPAIDKLIDRPASSPQDPKFRGQNSQRTTQNVQMAFDLTNEQNIKFLMNLNESSKDSASQTKESSNSSLKPANSPLQAEDDRIDKSSIVLGDRMKGEDNSENSPSSVTESNINRYECNANLSQTNEKFDMKLNEIFDVNKSTNDVEHSNIDKKFAAIDNCLPIGDRLPIGETDSLKDACFLPSPQISSAKKFEEIDLVKDARDDFVVREQKEAASENNEPENEQAQFPKTAKIFFQKSSKGDSSENLKSKSKIKASLLSVIKSDKKSSDKTNKKNDSEPLTSELANDDFISKVSMGSQKLNQVKKSSSFSSTTSLATTSSSDNLNSTNKENDCEFSNLISEFSDSFKLIDQTLITDSQLEYSKNRSSNQCLTQQQSFDSQQNDNSPPKPPSRAKSTLKLKATHHSDNQLTFPNNQSNVNSVTIVSNGNEKSDEHNSENQLDCPTITINQPVSSPFSIGLAINAASVKISENAPNKRISQPTTANKSSNCVVNSALREVPNKLTINVQATDQLINSEQSKLIDCTNVNEKISKNEQPVEQADAHKTRPNNGLWSNESMSATNSIIENLNKSKRSKSVKKLSLTRLFCLRPLQNHYESSPRTVEQHVVRKSNTMHFDHLRDRSRNVLQTQANKFDRQIDKHFDNKFDQKCDNKFDKKFNKLDKFEKMLGCDNNASKYDKLIESQMRDRSINESVDKLVSKSISRLADKSLTKIALNNQSQVRLLNEIVKNKSCSSLYVSVGSSTNQLPFKVSVDSSNQTKKSRIPYSKSSITLARLSEPDAHNQPRDRSHTSNKFNQDNQFKENFKESILGDRSMSSSSESISISRKILTDNYLDVSSSSSSCSLCTSMSVDSLESVDKKGSSRTSSLSNLNSPSDRDFEFSQIKTSNSMSKINKRLESLVTSRTSSNKWLDGQPRSLSNLTSRGLLAYTTRRKLKANSNHLFYPMRATQRELSRIDENSLDSTLDDEQSLEQSKLKIQINKQTELNKQVETNRQVEQNKEQNKQINRVERSKLDMIDCDAKRSNELMNAINQSTDTKINNRISSFSLDNMHGMDESSDLTFKSSCNTSKTPDNQSNCASVRPLDSSLVSSTVTNNTKPSLNQFKSSLINQLIDSNSHLMNDLYIGSESTGKIRESSNVHSSIRQPTNSLIKQSSNSRLDEIDSNEQSTIGDLNDTQQNIFNSKKNLFAKNRSLMSKTDSCRSFEMNERIVDLEMQLAAHKTKFNESLNLIKVLSDHCNDLIQVFNSSYNTKLNELGELINENQGLVRENMNLAETCDDLKSLLKRNLNQELNQIVNQHHPVNDQLEHEYNKLKSALDHSKQNEQQLNDELNNLKIKFDQNFEIYERVKQKALEKVESANQIIESANKSNEREMMLAKFKIQKLENELELKIKENFELNRLLDSLK